jgi:hypothetical protein
VTGRRGRRRRKLVNDLKERRGYSHLKEEALDRTIWRARFRRGFGSVVRQTAKLNDSFPLVPQCKYFFEIRYRNNFVIYLFTHCIYYLCNKSSSSSCSWRVRHVSYSLVFKMKLVPPSLPRSSYVTSSFSSVL